MIHRYRCLSYGWHSIHFNRKKSTVPTLFLFELLKSKEGKAQRHKSKENEIEKGEQKGEKGKTNILSPPGTQLAALGCWLYITTVDRKAAKKREKTKTNKMFSAQRGTHTSNQRGHTDDPQQARSQWQPHTKRSKAFYVRVCRKCHIQYVVRNLYEFNTILICALYSLLSFHVDPWSLNLVNLVTSFLAQWNLVIPETGTSSISDLKRV